MRRTESLIEVTPNDYQVALFPSFSDFLKQCFVYVNLWFLVRGAET